MNDRTITRASRRGTKSTPIEQHPKRTTIRSNIRLTPEEIAVAMELARSDRVEEQIEAYALRKRTAVMCV
jgi:hypothetical protein